MISIDVNWSDVWFNLSHLGVAYLLALPVAMDREAESRSAGLRTFPLVAMAACGYTLVGNDVFNTAVRQGAQVAGLSGLNRGIA